MSQRASCFMLWLKKLVIYLIKVTRKKSVTVLKRNNLFRTKYINLTVVLNKKLSTFNNELKLIILTPVSCDSATDEARRSS